MMEQLAFIEGTNLLDDPLKRPNDRRILIDDIFRFAGIFPKMIQLGMDPRILGREDVFPGILREPASGRAMDAA